MPSTELVRPPAEPPEPRVPTIPDLQLQVDDVLASGHRLWVRGRLIGLRGWALRTDKERRWWSRWWRRPGSPALFSPIRLETRISGHLFEAEIPLEPDGRFEATFAAELPAARRGWRIARNRVTWEETAVEKCSVLVRPADDVRGVAVVVLPWACTAKAQGAQRLARSEEAARLTPVLRRLQQAPSDLHAIFYLAGVSGHADPLEAELALATTTLGWPAGNFLLLPLRQEPVGTIAAGLDRLRWLFAGGPDLLVLNLDPAFSEPLTVASEPKEDRAAVRRLVNPLTPTRSASEEESLAASLALRVRGARTEERSVTIRPARSSLVPRYPVVFCHGMLAMTTLRMQTPEDLNCFSALRGFLRERGFRALFPQVAPTGGIVARARQLREQIVTWTDEPVNIIAHSMGGLDARYLITHLGMADRVRSLTTIATPHRGTYLVDWFIQNFRNRVPLLLAMEAMGMNVDGFRDCRPSACRDFNARTPDMPGVRYFSYLGSVPSGRVTPMLRRAWSLLNAVEGPNDGMVSVESARWGECLGILHADHFAQTPDRIFVRPGEDFDALGFYFRLLEDLARRGF
jgi:triacylglycerol lipase